MRKSTDLNMLDTARFSDRGTRIEPKTDQERLTARFGRIVHAPNPDLALIEVSRFQRAALMNLHARMKRNQTGE